MNRKAMFDKTYKENLFQGTESISGPGSDLSQTKILRKALVKLCEELKVKILIDAPSGDCNWVRVVWPKLSGLVQIYIGCDIVEEMVIKNKEQFESDITVPKLWFEVLDIVNEPLPAGDLMLCRDCLVHLSFDSVKMFLKNFVESNIKYLLVTSFTNEDRENYDYIDGTGWYALNFLKPPFNFPKPIKIINEGCTEGGGDYKDKSLFLYKREDLVNVGFING